MADSEKGNSSNGEAKAKVSLLDEDFSKDFLSSWKSMSTTGGDDMDFNFEPVSKGKKKAFDFGMDMDFSLDDAFGKMSSFKMDMPDLDFSSSPKKSTKSKEKSEEDSAKENRREKHDKFDFSFDFNGLDDFSLDAPSTKGGKSGSSEKKSKNHCFENEDLPRQVKDDSGEIMEDIMSKGPPVCEDAPVSISEDLVVGSGNPDTQSGNSASVPSKGTLLSSDKKYAEDTHKTDYQSFQEKETSLKKSCSPGIESNFDTISVNKPPQSTGLPMPRETTEVHMSSETERTMTALKTDDEIQLMEETISKKPYTHLKGMDSSANSPLVEASTQANVSEEMEISSPDRNLNDGSSEGATVIGEHPATAVLASDAEELIVDNSKLQCSIEKLKVSDEKNELGGGGSTGIAKSKIPLNAGNPSTTREAKAWSSSARSSAEMQKQALKVSSATFRSGPTTSKTMLSRNKVPGAMNSKLPVIQGTNDGCRTEFSSFENNGEGSTHVVSVDRSYGSSKDMGNKTDEHPKSCTKKMTKQDSDFEKSKKNAAVHATSSDHDDTINGKNRVEVSVDTMPNTGKAAKDGLPSLEQEKMIQNVTCSGFRVPSLAPPEQGDKVGNQVQEKFKDNISRIASIQKVNIGPGNKLSSQKVDKKMHALPSLNFTSTTTDKNPAAPSMQLSAKSLGNSEKSTRLQARIKMASPVIAEKESPLTPLKRKPSEAADMVLAKLHTAKRASPSESRMSNVSARELEDEVQTQNNFSEGSGKIVTAEYMSPKFDFDQEANLEALQFSSLVENDANVEKAEACAKELDNICNMLKKKHEEAKELLVRALVNNNNLLMLNHPIYEEKIRAVQRFASKLMSKDLQVEA